MNKKVKAYTSLTVTPQLTRGILEASLDTLSMIAICTGKPVGTGVAPLLGKYVKVGQQLVTAKTPESEILTLSFLWCEEGDTAGQLTRIGICTKTHGPLMVWLPDTGWKNLYSKLDFDPAFCSTTGGWNMGAAQSTLTNAIKARDYMCNGTYQDRNAFIEGPGLYNALYALAAQE